MFVYVLNQHGKPLMPCTPAKARRLLNSNKAKVIKRTPFTLQLLYGSSGYTQSVSLGVDAGSKHIGLSATTESKVLFEGQVDLRTDIVKLLATRRAFRSTRRSRKSRYRKARFLNRRKPKGWLAPSIENKIENHLKVVKLVHSILPIKRTIVEVAQFDLQKIRNPEIQGKQYQEGDQLGFWNVREYVLWRDGHQCQHCKGKSKDVILNVHHIESRKIGGNAPNNLITLCATCHGLHHKGKITVKVKRGNSYRDAAFMGIMRWTCFDRLREIYPDVSLTYGYITKNKRIQEGLVKTHRIDARCISEHPNAAPIKTTYLIKQVRGQNRQLHKATIFKGGVRKANKAARYVKGFQLFDKVLFEEAECFVFGRRSSGSFDIRLLDGTKIHAGISFKKLTLVEKATSLLFERKGA